jgi:hypothetical protein
MGIDHKCSWGSVVDVATSCRLDGLVSNPGRGTKLYLLRNHQCWFWDRDVGFATQFIPVPRLRINGAVHLFPLYAFMTWTGTAIQWNGYVFFGACGM